MQTRPRRLAATPPSAIILPYARREALRLAVTMGTLLLSRDQRATERR